MFLNKKTLAQMKLCKKSWLPEFSSLIVEPKVGMVLPLALVRVTLTGWASCGDRVCGYKVTAELPSTTNLRPLSWHWTNNIWCFGRLICT